jgi:hypothetical protein
MTSREIEYRNYINDHVANVKKVWVTVKPWFKESFYIDAITLATISNQIERHDASKYLAEEFNAYRKKFYPEHKEEFRQSDFDKAWNHHQKHNTHHWEYWVMPSKGECYALDIPLNDLIEMLCDWSAMSLKFKDTPKEFFEKNKENMILSSTTQKVIKHYLPLFDDAVKSLLK